MKVWTALGDYSCLKVRLHFTRDKWFYYTTVFVPGKSLIPSLFFFLFVNIFEHLGLILVTSSFVTFWIEWNAEPARVMLGVTTMLNFFTTSNKYFQKCQNKMHLVTTTLQIPLEAPCGLQPDSHEPLGRCLHVLHLCLLSGIHPCKLSGKMGPGSRAKEA